jgi:hypothetical protein
MPGASTSRARARIAKPRGGAEETQGLPVAWRDRRWGREAAAPWQIKDGGEETRDKASNIRRLYAKSPSFKIQKHHEIQPELCNLCHKFLNHHTSHRNRYHCHGAGHCIRPAQRLRLQPSKYPGMQVVGLVRHRRLPPATRHNARASRGLLSFSEATGILQTCHATSAPLVPTGVCRRRTPLARR